MGLRTLWLWPLYPLQSASGGNIQREVDAEDGKVVSVEVVRESMTNIKGSDCYAADYYVPTAMNLAVLASAFPGMNPLNPDWADWSSWRSRLCGNSWKRGTSHRL